MSDLERAKQLYIASLSAMEVELTGLLSFAMDFRPAASHSSLFKARELVNNELKEVRKYPADLI